MRSRRQKNLIILSFWFYSFLLIVMFFVSLFYFYPKIQEIESLKKSNLSLLSDYNRILNKWQNYKEFLVTYKENYKKYSKENDSNTEFFANLVEDMDEDFYKSVFTNTWTISYDVFLSDLFKDYTEKESEFQDKINITSNILPIYSENISPDLLKEQEEKWSKVLSDFIFVNYIEKIINTFNLSYSSPIGISWLSLVDEFSTWQWWNMEKNIYYIPLSLNITGKKSDILNFIYFADNVWSINILSNQDLQVPIPNTPWFDNFHKNITLKWDKRTNSYNIFNNQIFDIENITMSEYIDSDRVKPTKENFYDYLFSNQSKEDFSITVSLRFYVKWIPNYVFENYIEAFREDLKKFTSDVWVEVKSKLYTWYKLQRLKNLQSTVLEMQKQSIKDLAKSKDSSLEWLYSKAYSLSKVLEEYKKELNDIIK